MSLKDLDAPVYRRIGAESCENPIPLKRLKARSQLDESSQTRFLLPPELQSH